jgi:hypothetical protein
MQRLHLGPLGDADAPELISCARCCYYLGDQNPFGSGVVINGTHMTNGTQITPVIPSLVGYLFQEGDEKTALILPCAVTQINNRVYYAAPSSSSKHVPTTLFILLLLVSMVFQ